VFRLATSPIAPLLGQHLPPSAHARLLNRSYLRMQRSAGREETVLTTRAGDLFRADLSGFQEWNRWVYEALEDQVAELFSFLVQPGGRCVTVGTGIGLHAVRLAKVTGPAGEVMAFEPDPELARRAARNIALNDLVNARVIQAQVSDVAVDVTCPRPIAFMEIDAGERLPSIVADAAATIEQDHPALIFEYVPELLDGHDQGMFGRLADADYLLYRISSRRNRLTGRCSLRLDPLYSEPEAGGRLLAVSEGDAPRIISLVAFRDGRV
jgi:predicted O-methyltransferase YrrM